MRTKEMIAVAARRERGRTQLTGTTGTATAAFTRGNELLSSSSLSSVNQSVACLRASLSRFATHGRWRVRKRSAETCWLA